MVRAGASALPDSAALAIRRSSITEAPRPTAAGRLLSADTPPLRTIEAIALPLPRMTSRGRSRDALRWRTPHYRLQDHADAPSDPAGTAVVPDEDAPSKSLLETGTAIAGLPASLGEAAGSHGRTAALGVGADVLQFDDRPGRLSAAAEAGSWNGQPATAVGMGYTLPNGWARLNAAGVVNTPNVIADPKPFALPKSFSLSAVADIPLY